MEVTREIAQKVLAVVDAGLVSGMGEPTPGKMCVEAAVCFALGLPHSDEPGCVGGAVRAFKIKLNDARWPSDVERGAGLRKLAIAQLGSDEIDQIAFCTEVAFQTVRQIVPMALRAAAKLNPKHAEALEVCAVGCEAATNLVGARAAASAAQLKAREVRAAYAAAAASAGAYAAAAYAAYAYAAAGAAYAGAAAAAADAAAAYAAYADGAAARLSVLQIAADIGLQALIKLKSPGCAFLDLCEVLA